LKLLEIRQKKAEYDSNVDSSIESKRHWSKFLVLGEIVGQIQSGQLKEYEAGTVTIKLFSDAPMEIENNSIAEVILQPGQKHEDPKDWPGIQAKGEWVNHDQLD